MYSSQSNRFEMFLISNTRFTHVRSALTTGYESTNFNKEVASRGKARQGEGGEPVRTTDAKSNLAFYKTMDEADC